MEKSFIEEIVNKYSKKIFGFAMSKTKNVFEAEDLSQEILMNLAEALQKDQDIYNLDGFIYKLSFYTWSNYVRKNIDFWRTEKRDFINLPDDYEDIISEEHKSLLIEIRKKVAYLSGINQQIITMHYYENISLVDIAKKLNMNENTVRTNLRRTRIKLKEKTTMNKNLHYKPIRINFGHNGQMGNYSNITNLLGQNILYACYESAKTIEEIAEEVQVASCYLKDYLDQYLFHDWMTLSNEKYQTNFFICDHNFYLAMTKNAIKNIKYIALPLYKISDKYFNEFKSILSQKNFSDEALKWFFVSSVSQFLWHPFLEEHIKENIDINFMIRKDGYNYAFFGILMDIYKIDDDKFKKYYDNIDNMLTNTLFGNIYRGLIISEVNRHSNLESVINGSNAYIYDSYELNMIYELIKNDNAPNEKEKVILSKYIKEEVIVVADGKPKWNVIFMEKEEIAQYKNLLSKIRKEFDKSIFNKYLESNKQAIKQYIPKHLGKNMIEYYSSFITVTGPILVYLEENKYLKMPKRKECKTSSEWFYIYS